jgi:hypothetical protein
MRVAELRHADTWVDLGIEALWRLHPTPAPEHALTWAVPNDVRERVVVHWPARYQWPLFQRFGAYLLPAFRQCLDVEISEIPQPYPGIILTRFVLGGTAHEIAFDVSDYPVLNEECVRRCRLYFKFQYRREGYALPHVLPGGYNPGHSLLYRFLPFLRTIRNRRMYKYEVYGRFSPEFGKDVRAHAIALLSRAQQFRFEGGLRTVRYSRFLRDVARSKICIDLPGVGPFCQRLIDYLAVGACVVALRHPTALHVPLQDGVQIVYATEDGSDLVELCAYYLERAELRERVGQAAMKFFDRYLHRQQLVAYYVTSVLRMA